MFRLRKLFIAVISLAGVLAIYLLYNHISKTPPISINPGAEFISSAGDSNTNEIDGKISKIGNVGVAVLKKPRFLHRNSNKEVDREFGFEELEHEEKDRWDIEKPYLNIFQPTFICYITADRGRVEVETAVGRPTPKDATFTGNVVFHILPEGSGTVKESFLYLDDLTFLSEKTQFSSAGPIRFVSEDAQMLGTGMELVFNDELQRLEFLRIIDLKSLRIKSHESEVRNEGSVIAAPQSPSPEPRTPAADDNAVLPGPSGSQKAQVPVRQGEGEYYKCVCSKNVVIDTPEQLVFANQQVSINNIFWSRAASKQTEDSGQKTEDANRSTSHESRTTNHESPQQVIDAVVTCDGGVVVTPVASAAAQENSDIFEPNVPGSKTFPDFNAPTGRTTFVTRRIDYDASTGDAVAVGSSKLTFYVNDFGDAQTGKGILPAQVTARKQARFLAASKQVTFEDDCLCAMLREGPNVQERYLLSGQTITVDLPKDAKERSSRSSAGIEHLTTAGGVVRLATVKMAGEKLLGGIELKCSRFDYDAQGQLFLVTGPGVIKADNSSVTEPGAVPRGFSLRRSCYAFLRDFDTLKYFPESNRIIADARSQGTLRIDYIPIVKGKYGEQIVATAKHIEADLVKAADGQNELSTLTASGGITYEDDDNQFAGSQLFYDHSKAIMKVKGDRVQPCYFNGTLVDGIEYNLKTDKVKARVVGPGTLQLK